MLTPTLTSLISSVTCESVIATYVNAFWTLIVTSGSASLTCGGVNGDVT